MKVMLVTGATDGIGRATAQQLAKHGARVLVHGRNRKKVDAVVKAIREGGGEAEGLVADLERFDDVRRLAQEVERATDRLDVLVNNAGVYLERRQVTPDGHEATMQVNHYAHFLLTRLLLPLLQRSAPARVVNVASMVHSGGRIPFDDLELERGYSGYSAYANSKLANVLFTRALAKRLEGSGVTVNALHPGVVNTKLLREGFGAMGGADAQRGARTSVYLATSPEVEGVSGKYFVDARDSTPARHAQDDEAAERLWEVSERITGA